MATKKVSAIIKLQCPAGAATPAPPIGPALGPHGVSAPKFVQEFNDRTKSMEKGLIIPVVITVYQDKSYTFVLKTPPAAVLIKKAVKIEKGSGNPLLNKVATLSAKDLEEIAKTLKEEGIDSAIKWLKSFKNSELSHPRDLTFKWDGESGDVFEISKDEDFFKSEKTVCAMPQCKITNLEVGTEYFWRINDGKTHSFHTKDNRFRFIKIDGVLNVRDIGGININQGLLYRGSDMDICYQITDSGKKAFCEELKIKTEIVYMICGLPRRLKSSRNDF